MKTLAKVLIYFYPASWRDRYGKELEALMEDAGWRWRDLQSLLTGAIRLQATRTDFAICVGGFGAVGFAIAIGFAAGIPNRYVCATELRSNESWSAVGYSEALSRTALASLINKYDLYQDDRRRKPLEDVIDEMRNQHLQVRITSPEVMRVSFAHEDATIARSISREVSDRIAALALQTAATSSATTLGVTKESGWRDRAQVLGVGLGLGFFGGLMAVWLRRAGFRRSVFLVSAASAGWVICFLLADFIPEQYVSRSTLIAHSPEQYIGKVFGHEGIAQLRYDRHLYDDKIGRDDIEKTVARIRRCISVSYESKRGKTMFVKIAVTWEDNKTARGINQALITQINKAAGQWFDGKTFRESGGGTERTPVAILDPPSLPELPIFPWRDLFSAVGLLTGTAFGVLFSRHRTLFQRRLETVTA